MSPRLFGKGRKRHAREPRSARSAVLVDYRLTDVSVGHLDEFYTRVGYPENLEEGLLVHVGGVLDGTQTVYLSVWRSEKDALDSWRAKSTNIESVLADAPPNAEIRRRPSALHRIYFGDDLEQFRPAAAQKKPDCIGFVIDLPDVDVDGYELICERMAFPDQWPRGLIVHFAGPVDDALRVVSIWRRVADSREFFTDRLIPAGVEVAREFGLFPEIRPVELRVHMLAVNDADND